VVGPTEGTEFNANWDPDLSARMFPFWEQHGYLSIEAAMSPSDVGHTVCAVLSSRAAVWTTWVQGRARDAKPML
jgi:hypothetical protein